MVMPKYLIINDLSDEEIIDFNIGTAFVLAQVSSLQRWCRIGLHFYAITDD
jgi:hypothetical protein